MEGGGDRNKRPVALFLEKDIECLAYLVNLARSIDTNEKIRSSSP